MDPDTGPRRETLTLIDRRHALKESFGAAFKNGDMKEMMDWFQNVREHGEPLHFAREVMRLVNRFSNKKDLSTAQRLCVGWLADAHMLLELDNDGGFSFGEDALKRVYSYTFEFGFIKKLIDILVARGHTDTAIEVIDRLSAGPNLYDDARLSLQTIKSRIEGTECPISYRTEHVDLEAAGYDSSLWESIEEFALDYLERTSQVKGVVLDTDYWAAVLSNRWTLLERTGSDFGRFIRAQRAVFTRIARATNVTCGRVGLPDLAIFNPQNFSEYWLVEVKSPHDHLSEMQEAWIDFFRKNDIRFYLLQFTGKYRKPTPPKVTGPK